MSKKGKSKNAKKPINRNRKSKLSKAKQRRAKNNSRTGKKFKTSKRRDSTRAIRQYHISGIERYYGDMKAYIFKARNNKQRFTAVYSQKNENDFERLFQSLKRKILASPLPYSKIRTIQLAVSGKAKISRSYREGPDNQSSNEFPFWKGSVYSLDKCNKKLFFESLEDRKRSIIRKLEDFANDGEKLEYASAESNTAEDYFIETMRVYAEIPKSSNTVKKRRKSKKSKNRRNRYRDK